MDVLACSCSLVLVDVARAPALRAATPLAILAPMTSSDFGGGGRLVRVVPPIPRSRIRIAVVGAIALALGAGSRLCPIGLRVFDDHLGDACYAAMLVVALALASPSCSRARLGLSAFALGAAIEAFQLTGLPAEWARAFRPLALVFGTTFAWADVLAQAVGVVVATLALGAGLGERGDARKG